jgi:hypothetical protein
VVGELLSSQRIPARRTLLRESRLEILVTDLPNGFATVARRCLGGRELAEVQQIDLSVG